MSLSRRRFLIAAAGLAVGAACGREEADVTVSEPSQSAKDQLNLVVSSFVHVAGIDQRVTLAFLQGDMSPLRPEEPVQVRIDGKEVPAELHHEGIFLPYLLLRHRFERPGVATAEATYRGRTAKAALEVQAPAATKVPFPGQPMRPAKSPTFAQPLGVNPVCTRQPPCPLHQVSIDAALAERRPLAVLFSTPALCESRLCGPVLENLLAQQEPFGAQVRMIHVEIFPTPERKKPLVQAVEDYGLDNEPVLFLAGADGVARQRLDNAYDLAEIRSALGSLTA